ncbi:toll/interleukin-1 receptor domain-containing protein [Flavobacterium sp. MDT1-60]|uniref:toll/interleukin-1 receptor domain-containing protein n=1 Tax=Flavobacterium sp. MDT1-60 TaxID=1979344 RepID=UPI00177D9045|nr:toll/interleukin-1 receptor domain-containing protein [Flavobacterium sp. MDT1-60]QOG03469.1 toll/interleukin-1 receptor domain-containing protein [Flavobacterium sp. MDT1-60]
MSIFISYSHKDKDFVDKLGIKLVEKRIKVFIDRWEMKLGDSITNKIQDAITDASFLMVILSKSSIASDWCKREITTGLMLELEKRRIVVLPLLIEDCDIPLFLRDKFYADFRSSFDNGLATILESLSTMNNDELGRISDSNQPEIFSDYSVNWGIRGNNFELNIDVVEYSIEQDKPCTILTNIVFVGNQKATERFRKQISNGQNKLMKTTLLMIFAENHFKEQNAYLFGKEPFETILDLFDPKEEIHFRGHVKVKRLGPGDGKSKIYYFGRIFERIWLDEIEKVEKNK